ncbi:MAG TPA: hypothetical protein VFM36_11825 [Thermoanaerobaculia bacterium]|nr:hypothetical protein [Thermoanaerobaculia bacterium]
MSIRFAAAALLMLNIACTTTSMTEVNNTMNTAAERYVRLVLSLGEHDADYVDAYYGPPEWRQEIKSRKPTLDEVYTNALDLRRELGAIGTPAGEVEKLRLEYLRRQTDALIAKAEMLRGRKFTFDEESKALYDAVAPHNTEQYFQGLTAQLESELPGSGSLSERLGAFKKDFIIPKNKLDTVFRRAVDACRERTLQHIELPPGESFTIEYVTNKSWSGYNWYQGNYKSLIQVNTDLPIYIDRAIDLACHEGYPGHHVYNVLLEKNLMRDRGWVEYSVYPLNSPQSLIAEGSANYGIEMAFPGQQRVEFERTHLFPLAGIDPARAEKYYRINALEQKFTYAGNEAARRYLNGEINAAQAAEWLTKYGLYSPERAKQRIRFMDQYRSYVINYNLGKDLVRQYVQREAGNDPAKRWDVFERLLSTPRLPSGLQ